MIVIDWPTAAHWVTAIFNYIPNGADHVLHIGFGATGFWDQGMSNYLSDGLIKPPLDAMNLSWTKRSNEQVYYQPCARWYNAHVVVAAAATIGVEQVQTPPWKKSTI